MRYSLFLLLTISVLISSCRSMAKLYEEGQNSKVFIQSLKALDGNIKNKEALYYLEQSLTQLLIEGESQIAGLRETDQTDDWEKALTIVDELNKQLNLARPYLETWPFDDKEVWLVQHGASLRQRLYDTYYEYGLTDLSLANINDNAEVGRRAHQYLLKAARYCPATTSNMDSLNILISQALDLGKVYYQVVEYNRWTVGSFYNLNGQKGDYVVVTNETGVNKIDCMIKINVVNIDFDYSERSRQRSFRQEVFTGHEFQTDTAGNRIQIAQYATVDGFVDVVTSKKTASLGIEVNVDKYTQNCLLNSSFYQDVLESEAETFLIGGDERAIPNRYLCSRDDEHRNDDDMTYDLFQRLAGQVMSDYFSGYLERTINH